MTAPIAVGDDDVFGWLNQWIEMYLRGGLIKGTHELDNARTAGCTVMVFAQLYPNRSRQGRFERLRARRVVVVSERRQVPAKTQREQADPGAGEDRQCRGP